MSLHVSVEGYVRDLSVDLEDYSHFFVFLWRFNLRGVMDISL